jgi:hypothetical protein
MAFNPFAGFAKHRRLWLAGVMILVMITFVLCTGSRGDMADKLLTWFRIGGTPVASIAGRTYYRQDFDMLAKQRKVANDFMHSYARLMIDLCSERLRVPVDPKDEEASEMRGKYAAIRQLLTFRTKDTNFFEGPTKTASKVDDLIDFRVWLAEADRLGIKIPDNLFLRMLEAELFKDKLPRGENMLALENKAMEEVIRAHSREVTPDFVRRAIENEFRVRIARLADEEYQLLSLGDRQLSPYKRIKLNQLISPTQIRVPLSPNQIWDFYKENRNEFDVALMPIPVSAFASEVAAPEKKALEDFFEKHKKTVYDPASDQPGFKKPHLIRAQYVTADKNSPYFKRIVQTSRLFAEAPIGSLVPQMPLATALTFAAGPAMSDLLLARTYESKRARDQQLRFETFGTFALASDPAAATAVYLARKNPATIASMVGSSLRLDGGFAGPLNLLAAGYQGNDAILAEARRADIRDLVPLHATLIASGTMPSGVVPFIQNMYLTEAVRPLPLAAVRKEILKDLDEYFAIRYVNANMAFIKKKLEDDIVAGKALQVQRLLERYGPRKPGQPAVDGEFRDLGLEIGQTEKFYDRYTIKDAPELKPLLEAYQRYFNMVNMTEGRDARPESKLKDDDFWKLFFDNSEAFSAAHGKYQARPWPPVIKLGKPAEIETLRPGMSGIEGNPDVLDNIIRQSQNREPNKDAAFNLFTTSDRPFLFWRGEEKAAEIPESLADVEPQVLEAWKLHQARETKVLPYIRKIADSLLAGNADYVSMLEIEPKFGDKKTGEKKMIELQRLAPLYREQEQPFGPSRYTEFKIPRGKISYPREDMTAQVLSLNDLQKPIETGVADLDRLNADLFQEAKNKKLPGDKFVQILTNKPRDTYYVAVVSRPWPADTLQFFGRVLPGAANFSDTLLDRVNERIGEEHARAMVRQLRKDHNVTVYDAAKTMFDSDGGQ